MWLVTTTAVCGLVLEIDMAWMGCVADKFGPFLFVVPLLLRSDELISPRVLISCLCLCEFILVFGVAAHIFCFTRFEWRWRCLSFVPPDVKEAFKTYAEGGAQITASLATAGATATDAECILEHIL